jgi:uncharacterized protein (DUF427 family)
MPEQRIPGPDHPITVTPTEGTVTVHAGGRQIASSTAALTLQESTYPAVQYVPLADVDPAVLRESASHTYCPYKGEAAYFDLVVEGAESTDTVWVYRAPYDAVADIKDHVAFYADRVDIAVD